MASPCNSLNVQTIKVSSLSAATRAIKASDLFLMIQNDGANLYSRKSTFADLVKFLKTVPSGSYSGSFTGSAKGNFTGSFTGSFKGYMSASNAFGNKAAFHGTASWAKNANNALTAESVTGGTTGTGTANQFTYWTGASTLGSTPYLQIDSTINNLGNYAQGRISVQRPLQMFQGYLGQQFIQYSQSYEMYDVGLQYGNNYIRTGKNFALFYSGSFDNGQIDIWNDAYWRPSTAAKTGKNGWTVLGVRQRLLGIGHFPQSSQVNAQCHVHLSSSYGWPYGYNPNSNVILATSGSSMTKLLKLSGSGQLDVAGDIVAASTFSTSDIRLKSNIKLIDNACEKLLPLNPVSFVWSENKIPDFGLIAQEVENVYPQFVKEDMGGYKNVKYTSFIPLLIKTVQDQQKQLSDMKEKLAALSDRINSLVSN